MTTICFYQDSRHEQELFWIRKILGIGYLSHRNDGMSELRINGFKQTREILENLLPYIKFKKHQAVALYKATSLLESKRFSLMTKSDLYKLVSYMHIIQTNNYRTKRKKTKSELLTIVGLTP